MRIFTAFVFLAAAAVSLGQGLRSTPYDPVTPYDHVVERRLRALEGAAVPAAQTGLVLRVETNTGQFATYTHPRSITLASSGGVLRAVTSPFAVPTNAHPTVWFEPPLNAETDPVFTNWLATSPSPVYAETDPVFTNWLAGAPLDPYVLTNHLGEVSIAGGLSVSGAGILEITNYVVRSVAAFMPHGSAVAGVTNGAFWRRSAGAWQPDETVSLPAGALKYSRGGMCASEDGANIYALVDMADIPGAPVDSNEVFRLGASGWEPAGLTGIFDSVACSLDGETLVVAPLSGYSGAGTTLWYRAHSTSGWVRSESLGPPLALVPDGSGVYAVDQGTRELSFLSLPDGAVSAVAGGPLSLGSVSRVAAGSDGLVYVGTSNGFWRYEDGAWSELLARDVLGGDSSNSFRVEALAVAPSGGVVWVSGGPLGPTISTRAYRAVGGGAWAPVMLYGSSIVPSSFWKISPDGKFMLAHTAASCGADTGERLVGFDDLSAGRLSVTGPLIVGNNHNVADELHAFWMFSQRYAIKSYNIASPYAKFHSTNSAATVFPTTSAWHAVEFDFSPGSENFGPIVLTNATTVEFGFSGHVEINGCLRAQWRGADNTTAWLASRIVYSTNAWATTNEARCLQAFISRARQANELATLPYAGSLTVTNGTQIRLEASVSATNMVLSLNPLFANPVKATINIFTAGAEPRMGVW